jgi:DNA-binding response OmpR family regulator
MKTILLADDDQMILDLYNLKFTKAGFNVVLVSEGAEVLSKVKENSPSVILLDRRLGDADGMELLKTLRSTDFAKNTPIILLSNQDPTNEELLKLKSLGHAEYLVKEKIDLNELVEKTKTLCV